MQSLDCGVAFILCISKLDLFLAHSSYSLNVYVCVGWCCGELEGCTWDAGKQGPSLLWKDSNKDK